MKQPKTTAPELYGGQISFKELHDRWWAAVLTFRANPTEATKRKVLESYPPYYCKRVGNSIGLDTRIAELNETMTDTIRKATVGNAAN